MASAPSLFSMLDQDHTPALVVLPWQYVRMRRLHAGLSIEQAARPYWHRPEHQADVERNMRRLEEPGYALTWQFYVADMSRAYPFKVEIYRQLCTLPPERHPRLCLACGWDQFTPQFDRHGDEVRWTELNPHLCTGCELAGRPVLAGLPADHHS